MAKSTATKAAVLVRRFVDFFTFKGKREKLCAVVVVNREGKVLAQDFLSSCPQRLVRIALVQAKEAARNLEVRCADRAGGKGPIRGYFGGVVLPTGFYVGFYVRHMSADSAALALRQLA